jgi:hypothetical protein
LSAELFFADGKADRAAVVGWIVLGAFVVAVLLGIVIYASIASENALDRLAQWAPPGSLRRWAFLLLGLVLVATGFIFVSWGVAIVGGFLVFIFWRIVERPDI